MRCRRLYIIKHLCNDSVPQRALNLLSGDFLQSQLGHDVTCIATASVLPVDVTELGFGEVKTAQLR